MSSLTHCPNCGQRARVPVGLDPETVLRCPICEAEFAVNQVGLSFFDSFGEADPAGEEVSAALPELVPVAQTTVVEAEPGDGPAQPGPTGDVHPGEASEEAVHPAAIRLLAPGSSGVSQAEGDSGPRDTGLEPSIQTLGGQTPEESDVGAPAGQRGAVEAGTPADGAAQQSAEGALLVEGPTPAEPGTEELAIRPEQTMLATGNESYGVTAPALSTEAEAAAAIHRLRSRRRPHPIRHAIGIILSGLVGLALAYGVMSWLGVAKLRLGRSPPARAGSHERESGAQSNPSAANSRSVQPAQPASWDEFPGLEEDRFADKPKDAARVQSQPGTSSRPGLRKSP